jgi:hypothetical protein
LSVTQSADGGAPAAAAITLAFCDVGLIFLSPLPI